MRVAKTRTEIVQTLNQAVIQDDVDMLKGLALSIDELTAFKFEDDMNILNYVIDQESHRILGYLANILKDRP